MKYKPLPIGIDNFEKLITEGYYLVDKTLMIRDLLDKKGEVNLFTRPRRFGKTLNMSMLQSFFEDARDDEGKKKDNSALFDGLDISRAGEEYTSQMGQYPVVFLTFKEAKKLDFDTSMYELCGAISDEYKRHAFVLEVLKEPSDRERFCRIKDRTAERMEYGNSLKFLSECLEKYYRKKTIILIDEYDVPLENAYLRGFYEKMVDFIRGLLSSALKTNSSLQFAVMTGCLRISKESIFTGLNNLNVFSVLSDNYDKYFGFTEGEVKKLCEDYGMPEKFDIMREWYNGYIFGRENIYNPWSIIKYMFDLTANPNRRPEAYWVNTSSNDVVKKLVERADTESKSELEILISGGTIEKTVHEDITYDEVYQTPENLWNFMFFTGYFRKVSERVDEDNMRYLTLAVPNEEIRYLFKNKVKMWFDAQIKERDLSRLHNAVINKDIQTVESELNDIFLATISYLDANESYYHGILAGLLSGIPGYIAKSNREGGTGRSDLVLLPIAKRKEAFVFEFKKTDDIDELEEKAEEALVQIEDRKYREEVRSMGYKIISSYGIAFCGKECLVKWRE